MKRTTLLVATGVLALVGSVSAIAAVGDSGWSGRERGDRGGWRHGGFKLMRLDANKDGAITLDEFMVRRDDRFAKLDTNKDGVLSPEEIVAPMKARTAERDKDMITRLDVNGDGKISKEEFEHPQRVRFSERDRNDDGELSREDRPRWHRGGRGDRGDNAGQGERSADAADAGKADAGKSEAKSGDDGEGRHHGRRSGRGPMTLDRVLERTDARFKDLDKNGDGFIDAAELAASHDAMLAYQVKKTLHRLDKDKDGKLTKDEYTARTKERFANLDLDGDGKITAADLPPGAAKRWKSKE